MRSAVRPLHISADRKLRRCPLVLAASASLNLLINWSATHVSIVVSLYRVVKLRKIRGIYITVWLLICL